MSQPSPFIQAEVLAQLHSLDVAARAVVDGVRAGAHRSVLKGHSVDFADHREYMPGDDLRHLDWKVLGRRDRLVLKRYEAEIDLGCHVVVDGSGSMAYQGERSAVTKYHYASVLAASLAYLVVQQQDRIGLQIFAEDRLQHFPAARQGMLERICHALEEHKPQLGTDLDKGIEQLAAPEERRGLIVVFSDFLIDPDQFKPLIDKLRHRGHDVACVWVLDPQERDLSVPVVSRFEHLEGDEQIVAEPNALRRAYAEQVHKHSIAMETACRSRGVPLISCTTDQAPHIPLNQLLVALQHTG